MRLASILTLSAVFIISRLAEHPWNLAPVGAAMIFAGFQLKQLKFFAPLMALYFITDLFIGFEGYSIAAMISVYVSYLFIFLLGAKVQKERSLLQIGIFAIASSLLFFFVTNTVHWIIDPSYSKSISGLIACYIKALPFFRGTFFGDFVYSFGIYGIFHLVERYVLEPKKASA